MADIIQNKQARWRYHIKDTWEVGLALTGQEVKSLKTGRGEIRNAFVVVRTISRPGRGRPRFVAELINAHIPPYEKAGPLPNYNPRRSRRLLFHRQELARLVGELVGEGLTLVPIKVYTRNRRLKLLVGLARGATKVDKRETIRRRELNRELRRSVLSKQRT